MSEFHKMRSQYQPQLPEMLRLPELNIKTHVVPVKEKIRNVSG